MRIRHTNLKETKVDKLRKAHASKLQERIFLSSPRRSKYNDCAHQTKSQNHQEIVDLAGDLEKNTDTEFTSQKERQFNINYAASDNDETETIVNILGGSCRSGQWKVPREIRIITLFGGADIDFTDAIFTTPNVTIKILCLFGGTDISVPEDINVISKAFCILGGIDNSAPSIASRQAPTLTIEGLVMFGGLDIKIKRTIKEKFVAFANQMKTMFNNRV